MPKEVKELLKKYKTSLKEMKSQNMCFSTYEAYYKEGYESMLEHAIDDLEEMVSNEVN